MGFFTKSNAQRKVIAQSHGGRTQGGNASDSGSSPGTEQIRANLANLFREDDGDGEATFCASSESHSQHFASHSPASRYSAPLVAENSRHKSPGSHKSPPNIATRSKSSAPKPASKCESPIRPLMSLASSIENMGSPLEGLTPLSAIAPTLFPDAGKSGIRSPASLGGGPSNSSKWPHQSSKGRGASPRQRSFHMTSPSAQSPNGRKSISSRTNSIQRIARRASSLKRKPSMSMKLTSSISADQEVAQTKSPPPSSSQSHSSVFSRSLQVPVAFSESPTTPHGDLVQADPVRKIPSERPVPVYGSLDDFASQSFDTSTTVSGPGKENAQDELATNSARHQEVAPLPVFSEDVPHTDEKRGNRNEIVEDTSEALAREEPALKADEYLQTELSPDNSFPSPSRSSRNWDCIEAADFKDTYGLDVATARDFPASPSEDGNLEDSVSSPSVCDEGFSPHAQSNENDTDLLAPSAPAHGDAEVPIEETPKKTGLSGAKQKSKGKARKRPPPLLAPEPPSGNSTPNSTSSNGVFASNGDFTTGGFRITSEGMVGKPDRVTRRDSDDAPSTAFVPMTTNDLLLVRGLQEFRKGPTLGMGAAGRVYLAIHEPSGKSMAIKHVNVYDEAKRNQLLKELDTLSSHVSRFLVRFYGAFYDGKGAVHIALEFMDGGCLDSTVAKFGAIPEPVTKMIAVDCLRALRFLHRHNVLHRDFKTANILLSKRSLCAKVSDFGLARDMDAGVSRVDTFVGTIAYMSPERLHGGKYTYASDIWALGISIVECILGRYPFDKPQSYFDYLDVQAKDMLKGVRGVSRELKDFVQLCTDADPRRRPTAAQLMQHPWLDGMKRDPEMFRLWMDTLVSPRSDVTSTKSVQSIRSFLGGQQ